MHIDDEHLIRVVQCPQEGRLLAVATIEADPRELHATGPCRAHNLERELTFGSQLARFYRDLGLVTAVRVVDPAPRQVEPHVHWRVSLSVGQHAEYRHLTIVHFAQASAPLPGNADGAIALLGEAALVDDQRAGRLATQQAVGIPGDLLDHRLVPPRGVADEMLELLCATLVNQAAIAANVASVACARPYR